MERWLLCFQTQHPRRSAELPATPEQPEDEENDVEPVRISLDRLAVGQQGIIVRVGGESRLRHRLLEMGVIPGETVTVKRVAPLGDPLELTVKGYQLSLRKSEAARIMVELP